MLRVGCKTRLMTTPSYDIFRRDDTGDPVWIEAVTDLEAAKGRIRELSAATPGRYVVFSQKSGRMVSGGTVLSSPAARTSHKESTDREVDTLWK